MDSVATGELDDYRFFDLLKEVIAGRFCQFFDVLFGFLQVLVFKHGNAFEVLIEDSPIELDSWLSGDFAGTFDLRWGWRGIRVDFLDGLLLAWGFWRGCHGKIAPIRNEESNYGVKPIANDAVEVGSTTIVSSGSATFHCKPFRPFPELPLAKLLEKTAASTKTQQNGGFHHPSYPLRSFKCRCFASL